MGFWDKVKSTTKDVGSEIKDAIFGGPGMEVDEPDIEDADFIRKIAKQGLKQGPREAPETEGVDLGSAASLTAPGQQKAQRGQFQLADDLRRQSLGQEKGAGELATERQVGRAQAAQQAQAASARGGGSALAARTAARQQADIGLEGAGQAQQAALSDQQQARQQLGQVLSQAGAQSLQRGTQEAQLDQAHQFQQGQMDQTTQQANADRILQSRQLDDNQKRALLGQLFDAGQAEVDNFLRARQIEAATHQPGMLSDAVRGFTAGAGKTLMPGGG